MSTVLAKARVVGTDPSDGKTQQLPEAPWPALYADGSIAEPPYDLEGLAALYESNATNKACIDAKVSNIVGLGYRMVRVSAASDEEELARVEALLSGADAGAPLTESLKAVWLDVETVGNGYLEITRNAQRQVDGFYHVPATTVRIATDRRRYVQIRSGKQQWFRVYCPGGRPTDDGLNEILHFKKHTPLSTYYGVPDVVAAMSAAAGDRAARDYNIDFFEHNAVPRMAIIVEGGQLSDDLVRQVQQFMESEIRGKGHKTLLLDVPGNDVKVRVEPLTIGTQDDAAFLGYRRANRDEIMMAHRVPPSKITVVENANLANSTDQDKTFREQVVRPQQRAIEYRINKLLRRDLGVSGWEFRFREMDLGEERQQAEIAQIYGDLGVWDVDEIRAQLGLAPVKAE